MSCQWITCLPYKKTVTDTLSPATLVKFKDGLCLALSKAQLEVCKEAQSPLPVLLLSKDAQASQPNRTGRVLN